MFYRSGFVRHLPLISALIHLVLCALTGLDANTSHQRSFKDQTHHVIARATMMKNFNGGILPVKPSKHNIAKVVTSNQQLMTSENAGSNYPSSYYGEHLLQDAGALSNVERISQFLQKVEGDVKPGIRAMRYGRRSPPKEVSPQKTISRIFNMPPAKMSSLLQDAGALSNVERISQFLQKDSH